jgi:signal peptidase I
LEGGIGAVSASAAHPAATTVPPGGSVRRPLHVAVGRIASTIGVTLALVLALLILLPTLLGFHRYVIVSGSMEPTIPTGSVVYDKDVPVAELAVGDIITFVPPPEYEITRPVTHRIIEIKPAPKDQKEKASGGLMFRTKGDANEDPDPWLVLLDRPTQDRVEAHLPYVGYIYIWLSQRWVQLLVIGLPALIVAFLIGRALWREAGYGVMDERAAKARKPAAGAVAG